MASLALVEMSAKEKQMTYDEACWPGASGQVVGIICACNRNNGGTGSLGSFDISLCTVLR